MNHELLTPSELREKGFQVLVESLGWVNAVRFVQQFDRSKFDYTSERQHSLPNWNAHELLSRSKQISPPK
ncbi:MAG TPA: hypothetical protein VGJ15_02440 [Pirellulales bacterium]|jgi:hypothetical protein